MSRQLIVTLVILACGLVPDRLFGDGASRLRDSLKSNLLNRVDLDRIEHGYYQQLLGASRRLDDLADLPGLRLRGSTGSPWSVPFDDAPLVMRVDDVREVILKHDDDVVRKGVHWHTNSQGMRDRDYAVKKPPRTFRIALVGDSIGAGWGIDVEKRFESILERVWNTRAIASSGTKVEIFNCAVPGHSPGQRWQHFSQVGWPLEARHGHLRIERGRRRLGRAAGSGFCWRVASAGIRPFIIGHSSARGRTIVESRRLQASPPAAPLGHPRKRLSDDGRGLPESRRSHHLDSPAARWPAWRSR